MNRNEFLQICEDRKKDIVYALAHLPDRVWFPKDIYPSEENNYAGHEIFQLTSKIFYDRSEDRLHLARNLYDQSYGTKIIFEIASWNLDDFNNTIILQGDLIDFLSISETNLFELFNSKEDLYKIIADNNRYFSYLRNSLAKYINLSLFLDLDLLKGIIPLLLWERENVQYFEFNSLGEQKGYYFALKR